MSFKAKLKVAGKELYVLGCSYTLNHETDATGRSSCISFGGKNSSSGKATFFRLMYNDFERKDSNIAAHKKLAFKEACLIDYKRILESRDQPPIGKTFTLSAKGISAGSGPHVNERV